MLSTYFKTSLPILVFRRYNLYPLGLINMHTYFNGLYTCVMLKHCDHCDPCTHKTGMMLMKLFITNLINKQNETKTSM